MVLMVNALVTVLGIQTRLWQGGREETYAPLFFSWNVHM